MEEKAEENSSIITSKNPEKALLQLISNFLPNVVQNFLTDHMGHVNLEELIKRKIDKIKNNSKSNQFQLFLLYFLLIDIDLKKYKNLIDEIINLSHLNIIKSSIIFKLYYYLLFKSYDDDVSIHLLRSKIQELTLAVNPKIKLGDFDREFEKTHKILLLKRLTKE